MVKKFLKIDKGKHALWLCECDCGNETKTRGGDLRQGTTTSCGCKNKEDLIKINTKHGFAKRGARKKTYLVWKNMKSRCSGNIRDDNKYYFDRGIRVCEEWEKSFVQFFNDMGECPYKMSIDRIDNNRNYEPGNCKWSTHSEQMLNRGDYNVI